MLLISLYKEDSVKISKQTPENNSNHRSLTSASAASSIITGLQNSSMFTGDTINITVIAKDSSGKFVTTGGDIFTVKISNLWNKYNDYYCKPSGATSPLSANVNDVMVDHNNEWQIHINEVTLGLSEVHLHHQLLMVEMNFDSGDMNFGATRDNFPCVIGSNLATIGIKSSYLHHQKVEGGDGHQVDLMYLDYTFIISQSKKRYDKNELMITTFI